jgi:hypothetical protein
MCDAEGDWIRANDRHHQQTYRRQRNPQIDDTPEELSKMKLTTRLG